MHSLLSNTAMDKEANFWKGLLLAGPHRQCRGKHLEMGGWEPAQLYVSR